MFNTPPSHLGKKAGQADGSRTVTKTVAPLGKASAIRPPVQTGSKNEKILAALLGGGPPTARRTSTGSTSAAPAMSPAPANASNGRSLQSQLEHWARQAQDATESAHTALASSRNLRGDIKEAIAGSLARIPNIVMEMCATVVDHLQLVGEGGGGENKFHYEKFNTGTQTDEGMKTSCEMETQTPPWSDPRVPPATEASLGPAKELVEEMGAYLKEIKECARTTRAIFEDLKGAPAPPRPSVDPTDRPSYANVAARTPNIPPPMHTIIVSSDDVIDTAGTVVGKIRAAVNARETGLRVDRVRKARDQKVVLGCHDRGDLRLLEDKLKEKGKGLKIEKPKPRNPQIVLLDVLKDNSDEEVVESVVRQNRDLLGDLATEEVSIAVKYKKKARNPHEHHIVLEVSPPVWARLTGAGKVYVDLQRVRVFDQSPLVQCSRCLGFGHGRRHCTAEGDACAHCGGAHLRAECPARAAGEAPTCSNCVAAKLQDTGHNAYDGGCPVRRKWDALARARVAYT